MKRSVFIVEIIILIVILCSGAIFASGELDTSFNGTGRVRVQAGAANDQIERIATQIDGKIVIAGYSNNAAGNEDFAVLRLNVDGTLDTSFNGTGKILKAIGPGTDYATGLAIQPDGKIIVSGAAFNGVDDDIALIRLNPDGTMDGSFGSGGIVTTSIRGQDRGSALALQYDGKIVVAGYVYSPKGNGMVLVRYNADGSLDTGFGNGGIVEDHGGGAWDFGARDVKVQPDGKIVVAGEGYRDNLILVVFAAARFLPDGTPDAAFGSGGKVFSQVRGGVSRAFSLALGEDGAIFLGGSSSDGKGEFSDYTAARYRADGSLDPAFGAGGVAITHVGDWINTGRAVSIQPDGRILLAGTRFENFTVYQNFGIVRYGSDGIPDLTFGANGLVNVDWDSGFDNATAMDIQADGKILVAGTAANNRQVQTFAMVRLLGDSPLPPAAGLSGRIVNSHDIGIGGARVTITNLQNGQVRTLSTSPFGYFTFNQLPTNNYYQVKVSSKGRRFNTPRTFRLLGNINGLSIPSDSD